MLQDDSRGLSQWLASKPDARLHAREAAAHPGPITMEPEVGTEREAFEAWLAKANPNPLLWNASDAMFAAWQASASRPAACEQGAAPAVPALVGWIESPHGAFRANPAYRLVAPQSVAWSLPVYLVSPTHDTKESA